MLTVPVPELAPFVLSEWQRHLASGCVELRETPSAMVRAACAEIAANPALDAHALAAEAMRDGPRAPDSLVQRAFARRQQDAEYSPIFMRKTGLAYQIATATSVPERAQLQAMAAALADVDTPKAPAVRKQLGEVLKARYGAPLRSTGAGDWRVDVPVGARAVPLHFDFGKMSRGFAYELRMPLRPGVPMPIWLSYESVLGLPAADWDLLRSDRLEQDLALWLPRFERLVAALAQVDWAVAPPG